MNVEEAFALVARERKYLESKVAESIKFKLRKVVPRHELEDLVAEVITQALERLNEGKIAFENEAKFIGYLLAASWFNYRDTNKKISLKPELKSDMELESSQVIAPSRVKFISLDDTSSYLPELVAEPQEEGTAQDKSDTYYAELCERVFLFLEECVERREFSFRDVGLFKMYLVNGYSGAKQLAAESDFSLDICRNALKKIKKRLRETDFNKLK